MGKQIVHADLATRNVLLYERGETVKITDFGLSKQLYNYEKYTKKSKVSHKTKS